MKTFFMIKPDGVQRNLIGQIISRVESKGFNITKIKMMTISKELAEEHYVEHKDKPFFKDLIEYMTSEPVVVQVLSGENCVARYRTIMGATNPENAEEGTIRKLFALNVQENSVHGSDSENNAKNEINFLFKAEEIVG